MYWPLGNRWPLGDHEANSQVNCSDVDIVDNSRAVSVIFTGELLIYPSYVRFSGKLSGLSYRAISCWTVFLSREITIVFS
jgi:hypothetical protein